MKLIKILVLVLVFSAAGCVSNTRECSVNEDCSGKCAKLGVRECVNMTSCNCVDGTCAVIESHDYLTCVGFYGNESAALIESGNDSYKAGSYVNITLWVKVPAETNAVVSVHGIETRRGLVVNSRSEVKLSAGVNHLGYEIMLPSCSPCSGLSPGNHTITAEVSYGGSVINASKQVIIEA